MERNKYEFQIDGNSFILKTFRSKEETDRIVNYVNNHIERAKKSIKYNNKAMYATLACLNIADDLYDTKIEFNKLKKEAKEPMENYGPVKEKFEDMKENSTNIKDLKERVAKLEKDLSRATNQRDSYKSELESKEKQEQKYKSQVEDLRSKLYKQEQINLQANKKLQQLLKD